MDYLHIDPRMDEHPDIEAAGFDGARVFEAVLRACARNDGRGTLRGKFAHPGWLARRMNLTREVIGGLDPETWVNHGLERCVGVGLLQREGTDILIPGWEKFYTPAKTGADRTRDWRRRASGESATVTPVTPRDESSSQPSRPSQPVTRDATPHHSTPLHRTKEEADLEQPQHRGFVKFEEARAERFGGIPQPPPPNFAERWPQLIAGHKGDEDWAFQTFQHFWEDEWAQKRKPPGSLQVFLEPQQWSKHVRPREQEPTHTVRPDCGVCNDVGAGKYTLERDGREYTVCGKCLAEAAQYVSPFERKAAGE